MTNHNRVSTFFYGGYMNFDVLANFGIRQREYHIAQLPAYMLTIGSAANVEKNGLETSYGIVTGLTHDELDRLYSREAQAKLGAQYLPEPVLAITTTGSLIPSLCYISYEPIGGTPAEGYIDNILNAAKHYNFPQSYIQHIESYK